MMQKIMIGLLVATGAVLMTSAAQSANWNGENASGIARTGYGVDRSSETPSEQDQRRWHDKAVGRGF